MKIPEWLYSIRSLATLMIIGTYCYLSIKGVVKVEDLQTITLAVITFYFAGKHRNGGGTNGQNTITGGN